MHRFWLGLAAVALLVGCRSATDAESHLALTLTSDRATLSGGDTAHLTVTLTNRAATSIQIPRPYCPHFFVVTDADNRSAGPPQEMCVAILVGPTELAAGETLTLHDSWAADSGEAWSRHTLRVGAGTYTLRAVVAGPEHPVTSDGIAIVVKQP